MPAQQCKANMTFWIIKFLPVAKLLYIILLSKSKVKFLIGLHFYLQCYFSEVLKLTNILIISLVAEIVLLSCDKKIPVDPLSEDKLSQNYIWYIDINTLMDYIF